MDKHVPIIVQLPEDTLNKDLTKAYFKSLKPRDYFTYLSGYVNIRYMDRSGNMFIEEKETRTIVKRIAIHNILEGSCKNEINLKSIFNQSMQALKDDCNK